MSGQRDNVRPVRRATVKLHNRRVTGFLMRDGTTVWGFKRVEGRCIYTERIRLSDEALVAMIVIRAKLKGVAE